MRVRVCVCVCVCVRVPRSQEEVGKPGEQGEHGFQGDKVCSHFLLESSNISLMKALSLALCKHCSIVKRGGLLPFP